MDGGDKKQNFLPARERGYADEPDEDETRSEASTSMGNPRRSSRPVSPSRASPPPGAGESRMYSAQHNAVSPTSQLTTPYRGAHYAEYPMSSSERDRARREEAEAAEAAAHAEAEAAFEQGNHAHARMLQDQLNGRGGDDLEAGNGGMEMTNLGGGDNSSLDIDGDDEHEIVYSFPWKTGLIAVTLLLLGLTCLVLGIVYLSTGRSGSFAFVLIGSLLVVPGGYQTYCLYHAWRGTPGFSFAQLVTFEGGR